MILLNQFVLYLKRQQHTDIKKNDSTLSAAYRTGGAHDKFIVARGWDDKFNYGYGVVLTKHIILTNTLPDLHEHIQRRAFLLLYRNMLKYLRKIYFLIFLNQCILRDLVHPRKHENLKIGEYDKYVVWRPHESSLDEPKLISMGVIVQPNIILTNSAQDLVNNAILINGTLMKKTSFIVHGKRESVRKLRFDDRYIRWRKAINLAETYPPNEFEPQLALIKLCHKIPLNSHYAAIAQLPKRMFKIGAKCVVLGLSKDNALASVLNADIVELDQCENDTLKLHESIVCVRLHYNGKQSHCEQIVDGSPLVCRGFIIGIGGMLKTCNVHSPRAFTGTFYHRVWLQAKIAEIDANTPILEEYSPLAKHIVVFGLIDGDQKYPKGLGVIIADNIVLTHYAEDLTEPGVHGLSENTTGFIIYGVLHVYNLKTIPRSNEIEWIEAKNLNGPHHPGQYKPQIALIKLNSTMNLESDKAEILPLPDKNMANGTECVVVGLGYEMMDRIVAIKAVVLNESYCKHEIPEINYSAICIDIPNPMGDYDQCDYFTGGAPLVCDGVLTAIVSAPCISQKPRPCTNIFDFRYWIQSTERSLRYFNSYSSLMKPFPEVPLILFISLIMHLQS
uniref:Peptidase S1 domain-containing protein n=1 Tax=Glossina palpalis gambiensis TaxID=67801 RepID=A0A1B0B6U8_9MUSC